MFNPLNHFLFTRELVSHGKAGTGIDPNPVQADLIANSVIVARLAATTDKEI